MARAVIGRLPVQWRAGEASAGQWTVPPANHFQLHQIEDKLHALCHEGKPLELEITIARAGRPRSIPQNRMMWALLTIMADAYNGGRAGGIQPEDCYVEMLEQYGGHFDYLEVPTGALEILRGCYRVVKVIELLDNERCTVKCGMGSSSFDTRQMRELIDGIFDRLAEMGVSDAEVTQYWREWRAEDLPPR